MRITMADLLSDALPDRFGDGPRTQDRRELARILNGPVLDAKRDNGPGLFGSDARVLE